MPGACFGGMCNSVSSTPQASSGRFTCVLRLTQTLIGVFSRGPPPGTVVVEGLAHTAVITLSVVFAVTQQLGLTILYTLACVSIALAPGAHIEKGGKKVFRLLWGGKHLNKVKILF